MGADLLCSRHGLESQSGLCRDSRDRRWSCSRHNSIFISKRKEKINQIYFPCTRRWGVRKRAGLEASCDAVVLEPEL